MTADTEMWSSVQSSHSLSSPRGLEEGRGWGGRELRKHNLPHTIWLITDYSHPSWLFYTDSLQLGPKWSLSSSSSVHIKQLEKQKFKIQNTKLLHPLLAPVPVNSTWQKSPCKLDWFIVFWGFYLLFFLADNHKEFFDNFSRVLLEVL